MNVICPIHNNVQSRQNISFGLTTTQLKDDLEVIESVLQEMISNPEIPISLKELSNRTGISQSVLHSRIHNTRAVKVKELWEEAQSIKHSKSLENQRYLRQLQKPRGSKSIYAYGLNANKDFVKAIGIIKQAVRENRRISYESIQKTTGLNKQEIDNLISDYMQYLRAQNERTRIAKEQQAKWYEVHKKDFDDEDSRVANSYFGQDIAERQADMIRDAIYRITDANGKLSYRALSDITGLSVRIIYLRLSDETNTDLKNLYIRAKSKSEE